MAKEKKEKPLKKESLIIKFQHLNPVLQEIIGSKARLKDILLGASSSTIRSERRLRALTEGETLLLLLFAVNEIKKRDMREAKFLSGAAVATALSRIWFAKMIQRKHRGLVKSMKEFGILRPGRIESKYPEGWLNPSIVAKTHPTFYVNWRGDLIFPKMTRTEYARLLSTGF